MVKEEQVKELAYKIWVKEGRPDGKHLEHYFTAKQILSSGESAPMVELASVPPLGAISGPEKPLQLAPSDKIANVGKKGGKKAGTNH